MKKIVLILAAIILLFGCEEKNKIEIINNYESEYYEVTTYQIIIQNLIYDDLRKQMNKEVNEIFTETNCKVENKPEHYLYELYIGRNGKIEKIKPPASVEENENK